MANSRYIGALFIVDDEYSAALQQKATRIQEIWDDYVKISEEIVGAQGSIAGSRAKAYSEFISVAKHHLGTKILDFTSDSEQDKKSYINMIDEADNVLY